MKLAILTIGLLTFTCQAVIKPTSTSAPQTPTVSNTAISQKLSTSISSPQQQQIQRYFIELIDDDFSSSYKLTTSNQQLVDVRARQQQSLVSGLTAKVPNFTLKAQLSRTQNLIVAEFYEQDLDKVLNDPAVLRVHPSYDLKIQVSDSIQQIKADQVWNLHGENTITGEGTLVAVIDTGIDYTHPDLGGCLGSACKVMGGYDFINDDNDPMDDESHGTHVAGIVAANGNLKGVAPDAKLLAYKACNEWGDCPDYKVIQAIEAASDPDGDPSTNDGADIINLSLSSNHKPTEPLENAINIASDSGILVVIAAGNNEESGNFQIRSPGNAEKGLTVAASSGLDDIADFSSIGYAKANGHAKPEIAAPGSNINSTTLNGDYQHLSGTSMAVPMVAGAAALLLSNNNQLTGAELKSLLMANTIDLNKPFNQQGTGIVDVLNAAQSAVVSDTAIINLGWQHQRSSSTSSHNIELKNLGSAQKTVSLSIRKDDDNPIDYVLSSQSLTLEQLEQANINIAIDVPANLPKKTLDNPAYIAWLDIITDNQTSAIPIALMHPHTITVQWPDFQNNIVYFELVDKEHGVIGSYLGAYESSQHIFPADPSEYAVIMYTWNNYTGLHYLGALLEIETDSTATFSKSLKWHPVEYDIVVDDIHIDQQGRLPSPYEASTMLVLPSYKRTHFSTQTVRPFAEALPQLYIIPPSDEMYYDSVVNRSFDHIGVKDMALPQRLDSASIQSDGKALFSIAENDIHKLNFAYADNEIQPSGKLSLNHYFSYLDPSIGIFPTGGTYLDINTPIQTRQLTVSPRPDKGFSYVSSSQDYSSYSPNSNEEDYGYRTAQYQINSPNKLTLTNTVSTKETLKEIEFENYQFNVKVAHTLPAFKAKLINKNNQYFLSFDEANSTALFSDNLLTHYHGQVQFTIDSPHHQTSWEIGNSQFTYQYSPEALGSIWLDSESTNGHFEFDQYRIEGTPVLLTATLDYDLTATDFSPPVIEELSIKTLGGEHTHLAKGSGEVHLTVNDDNIFSTAIFYKPSSESDWLLLAESNTNHASGQLNSLPEASYDLKIESSDVTGNKLTYIASPAFFASNDCHYDIDCDGLWNQFDNDSDNDGVNDDEDAFPYDNQESVDTDNDGIGNNADNDDDNDGVADHEDAFPVDASEWVDTDSDGISNNADTDDDNDGVADTADIFPLDASEWLDTDNDGIGNNADNDDDNDGVVDSEDALPQDPTESVDTDNDGIGNNADTDDDNDGAADTADAFPLDASEWLDSDSDGIGNNADTDDDNDGVADSLDAFPLDSTESVDTDNDGIGNNTDTDDDNDGVSDTIDAYPLDPSRSSNSSSNGGSGNSDNNDNADSGGSGGGSMNFWVIALVTLALFRRRSMTR
ncbi:S8 family peptidase [Shewanella waksmanii]|uniref:S8 family peptidase n=1 Tax=Shewanella waksmanii TaxID=213783 RepID=UPI0004ADA779|nr:S8 family serine peptidase [Shewanella waksmanii]